MNAPKKTRKQAEPPVFTQLHPRLKLVATLTGLIVLAGIMVVYKSLAAGDSLSLHPAQANLSLGSTVSVTILTNNGADPVKAIQAGLTYDQTKLRFSSISTATSAFPAVTLAEGSDGTVRVALTAEEGKSVAGVQEIAIVNFVTIGSGTTSIQFTPEATLLRANDSSVKKIRKYVGSYTITDQSPPSAPESLTLPRSDAASNTLSWSPSVDNVSVRGYRVFRNGVQVASSPDATYTDTGVEPKKGYSYHVVAFDAQGNVSKPSETLRSAERAKTLSADGGVSVSVSDLSVLVNNYGQAGPRIPGDLNEDGVVNIIDLSTLLTNFDTPSL